MLFCALIQSRKLAIIKSLCYHGVDYLDNCNDGRAWAFFLGNLSGTFWTENQFPRQLHGKKDIKVAIKVAVTTIFCTSLRFELRIIYIHKYMYIGVGSKLEVKGSCCAARSAAKKMESNFAALRAAANFFKLCTFRLQNKAFFFKGI